MCAVGFGGCLHEVSTTYVGGKEVKCWWLVGCKEEEIVYGCGNEGVSI